MFKIGDYVTRRKHNNDIVFKIVKIDKNIVYLMGADVRLLANSTIDDLVECKYCKKKENFDIKRELNISKYFYIPGKVLHVDTDEEYMDRCEKYYRSQKVRCFVYHFNIKDFEKNIINLIEKNNPDIVVITGHDAYYKNENKYLNSDYYIRTVKKIRQKYKNYNDLIIIAGACQSNYEGLMMSGANFASSPTHSNIHALDPAIIAVDISYSNIDKKIDIEKILNDTNYGSKGFGGIIINGIMKYGFPRKE